MSRLFLNTFLSLPICCWTWGKAVKADKKESRSLWHFSPRRGGFPGAGAAAVPGSAGRRERRAGEGEGEKMNSCRAIKAASAWLSKAGGNLIQPGASLPSAVWCLPGIQERGCLTAHFVWRAKGALPSHSFQRKEILAGGVSSFWEKHALNVVAAAL